MGAERTVQTTGGAYRGVSIRGVSSFLGMEYGQPPVGAARFLPARPARPHAGVRDALAFGPVSLQVDGRLGQNDLSNEVFSLFHPPSGSAAEGLPSSEDCLRLNVWAPTNAERLPVMVWIHGGAFRAGAGSGAITSGEELARSGRAIVVSLNHRLGIAGFLSLGHLLGDQYIESGSAGLSDIALALEWVRDNIAEFGGDPANVTLFGQSGGGAKVLALLRSPRARRLFHKCIVQSAGGDILSPEQGVEQTERVLRALDISTDRADEVLTVPPRALLDAQIALNPLGHGPCPVVDGEFLFPLETASESTVPMLVGSSTHEYSFFIAGEPWFHGMALDDMPELLERFLPGEGSRIAAQYRDRWPEEPASLVLSRILTERSFGLVAAETAELRSSTTTAPLYRYEFDYRTNAVGGILGAPHCIEIPFVFGTVESTRFAGSDPARRTLAAEVMNAWLSFAERGTPVAPGGLEWPTFEVGRANSTMLIDRQWRRKTSSLAGEFRSTRLL